MCVCVCVRGRMHARAKSFWQVASAIVIHSLQKQDLQQASYLTVLGGEQAGHVPETGSQTWN